VATPAPRTIVSAVRAYARQHDIFRPGPLIVAVSGGTDSVALALILAELRDEFGLVLHVAHFDHRTRARAAAQDAAFVASLADRIGAPIRVGRADRTPKNEEQAREARYTFLRRAAMQVGAGAIATGHTRDDQAETVLLHLTRGAGLAGVAAMRPLRDGIARPLLAIGRTETAAICRAAKIKPREDPTNRSLKFSRNRVRLRVLPELERINPQVRAALARFAEAAWQIDEVEQASVARATSAASAPETAGRTAWTTSTPGAHAAGELRERTTFLLAGRDAAAASDMADVRRSATRPTPDVPELMDAAPTGRAMLDIRALPVPAIARDRYLADAWRGATGIALSARQRAALTALAGSTAGTRKIDLPGGQAVREYDRLELAPPAQDAVGQIPAQRVKRGETAEWHGWRIAVDMPVDGMPYSATVSEEDAARIVVRARRPGDRMSGRGKLQDVFVNAKVPVRVRDAWPLVTLNGDDVIWVPGVTEPPRSGSVSVAIGRIETPVQGKASLRKSSHNRRVASKSERRPRGGKREHL